MAADPVTGSLMIGLMLGSAVLQKKAADSQAKQYEEEREIAELQGQQAEVDRRRQLRQAIGTQQALRASRSLDLFSPTGEAIQNRLIDEAERDITNIKINAGARASRFDFGAEQSRLRGNAALLQGAARAGGSLFEINRRSQETQRTPTEPGP